MCNRPGGPVGPHDDRYLFILINGTVDPEISFVSIVHRMHRRAIRATLVPLSNRDPTLPPIEKLSSHPEVPADATGTIYLWRQDRSQEAFEATLRNSANFVVPKTEKEIRERGRLPSNALFIAV